MNDTQKYQLIFNGAGALIALTVAGYFVHSFVSPESATSCAVSYATAMPLSLQSSSGAPMSAIELEARYGGRDISIADFGKVVPGDARAKPAVLEISLPKGSLGPGSRSGGAGGIGFDWRPKSIEQAPSACLSYEVWLPADFDFKRGGTLPGFFGTPDDKAKPGFTTRVMWRERGESEIVVVAPVNGENRSQTFDRGSFKLKRGAWTRIDQEIVLNASGKKNGVWRVWVDGSLAVDRKSLVFRTDAGISFAGAQVDVHYGGTDASFAAPKDTAVRLTPPVMQIN